MTRPNPIRILVAEDSPTQRKLLVALLRADPEIQVVGEASDGVEALAMARSLQPHVITMDVRMPRVDGLEATKQIMIEAPTRIILVSDLDPRAVEMSLKTLRAGALTVLRKPAGPSAPDFEERARDFIRMVKAMSEVLVVRHYASSKLPVTPAPAAAPAPAAVPTGSRRIVAIGASAGGPAALHDLIERLPPSFPAPVLVVQHIAPGFVSGLATWLGTANRLRVKVAEDGDVLAPGTVYVAPDDHHLGLWDRTMIQLDDTPAEGGFRPSATSLFRSVAAACGPTAIAVILTGIGRDGVAGLELVRRTGGHIIAQDESSSVVFGMPAAAIAARLPDEVLPLGAIAPRLVELVSGDG